MRLRDPGCALWASCLFLSGGTRLCPALSLLPLLRFRSLALAGLEAAQELQPSYFRSGSHLLAEAPSQLLLARKNSQRPQGANLSIALARSLAFDFDEPQLGFAGASQSS